jgi:hypothetical protein
LLKKVLKEKSEAGRRSAGNMLPLEKLLDIQRMKRATDPRDKVYSLLGLACAYHENVLNLDYTLTVQETYTRVVEAPVKFWRSTRGNNGTLHFLSWVDDVNESHSLPSWVPDWSMGNRSVALQGYRHFSAAGSSAVSAVLPFDSESDASPVSW